MIQFFINTHSDLLIKTDRFFDYIPLASSVTNLVDLFEKRFVLPSNLSSVPNNHYYHYLKQKSATRIIILLIPFLGNIVIGLYDFVNRSNPPTIQTEISHSDENTWQTKPIGRDFTKNTSIQEQRKAHEEAKMFLRKGLSQLGAIFECISSEKTDLSVEKVQIQKKLLDSAVFSFQYTEGVQQDIQSDSQKSDRLFMYGVASQFNGCEAPGRYTIVPGNAVGTYQKDRTQGPQAQLAFGDEQVELINCGGNRGFNGLCHVLDDTTKGTVSHGYFTPTANEIDAVIDQLRKGSIEYPCIGKIPTKGVHPVYQFLAAAPAFGQYELKPKPEQKKRDEVEFLCALHAYRAQFKQAIALANKHHKPIAFKAAAIGLGVFENNTKNVAKGFYQAALEYQERLKDANVKVQFQIFQSSQNNPDQKASTVSELLELRVSNS